jgi:hypothetical protein
MLRPNLRAAKERMEDMVQSSTGIRVSSPAAIPEQVAVRRERQALSPTMLKQPIDLTGAVA